MSLLVAFAVLLPSAGAETLLDYARAAQGRHAYGLYIKGKKAGWAIDEIKIVKRGGEDVLRSTSTMLLDTQFDGERSRKESSTTVHYSLEGEGLIIAATVWKKDDGIEWTREARSDGGKLSITTIRGKEKTTRTVAMPRDTLAGQRNLERWLRGKRKAGEKETKYTVAWEAAEIDEKETYTFKSRKSVVLSAVKTELITVTCESEGAKLEAEVFPDGRMYRAVVGGFLELRLEPEASARKMDGKLVDIMEATSIILKTDLGASGADVDELTLELSGLDGLKIPASRRQLVKEGKKGVTVTLKRDERTDDPEELSKEDAKRLTKATPRLQSDHEKVIALAKEIVDAEVMRGRMARKLAAWVNTNLKKSYADNADNALDVLDRKAGACVQHSLLFVALARAAGIPAREVGGVTYIKVGGKPILGWHAWAEYHDGRQWVSVDPTFGQQRVDGTHLKLSEGERDLAWANVVGKIKVKVLGFKKKGE